MNNKLHSENLDQLFEAIMSLKNLDECYAFFEDLCTVTELKAISQRFHVANLLLQNRVYNDIVSETGASTATISRVNRSLSTGNDGYRMLLERIGKI
ncbi:MAG: YerC/YecD family TrpR-related protein [Oscillospiraceae bacterium]